VNDSVAFLSGVDDSVTFINDIDDKVPIVVMRLVIVCYLHLYILYKSSEVNHCSLPSPLHSI
jgi:hypothetical protein